MSDPQAQAARRAAMRRVGRATGCGPRGCLVILLILVGGLALAVGLDGLFRIAFEPWSVTVGGRSTLLGEWVGTLKTTSGSRFGLAMRIDYHERSGRRGSTANRQTIEGPGQICNRRGERYDYRLSGRALDWSGSHSSISLGSVEQGVGGSGWGLDVRWEGDRLTLVTENAFEMIDERPTGGRSSLAEIDPVVGELRRGPLSGLEAVCRGLAEVR